MITHHSPDQGSCFWFHIENYPLSETIQKVNTDDATVTDTASLALVYSCEASRRDSIAAIDIDRAARGIDCYGDRDAASSIN